MLYSQSMRKIELKISLLILLFVNEARTVYKKEEIEQYTSRKCLFPSRYRDVKFYQHRLVISSLTHKKTAVAGALSTILFRPPSVRSPPTTFASIKRYSLAIGSLDRRVTSPLEC